MKTTDSVKDKFIKWLAEESGEPEHLVMLMQSVYINPESMFKFYSLSLAEARREWVEEMVKLVTDKKGRCRNGGFCSVKCGHAGWWTNNVLDEILKSPDLLTGDNPERKV